MKRPLPTDSSPLHSSMTILGGLSKKEKVNPPAELFCFRETRPISLIAYNYIVREVRLGAEPFSLICRLDPSVTRTSCLYVHYLDINEKLERVKKPLRAELLNIKFKQDEKDPHQVTMRSSSHESMTIFLEDLKKHRYMSEEMVYAIKDEMDQWLESTLSSSDNSPLSEHKQQAVVEEVMTALRDNPSLFSALEKNPAILLTVYKKLCQPQSAEPNPPTVSTSSTGFSI